MFDDDITEVLDDEDAGAGLCCTRTHKPAAATTETAAGRHSGRCT
ncbi:hypothetical protein ACWCQW_51170 [Streptomyces mirabilis]